MAYYRNYTPIETHNNDLNYTERQFFQNFRRNNDVGPRLGGNRTQLFARTSSVTLSVATKGQVPVKHCRLLAQ